MIFCGKIKGILLLLLLAIIAAAHRPALATDKTSNQRAIIANDVDNLLKKAQRDEGYPGMSVAIYLGGNAYYLATSGSADVATNLPPDQDTVFRLYSLTKGITQILAATLADAGALDLDAPISKYISGLPENIRAVTASQLLLHKAGFRHYKSDQEWLRLSGDHCENPEDAFKQFLNDPLVFEPGTATGYSSFGYVLLSKVLENAAGKPFKQLMQQRIWSPSQVHRIGFDNQPAELGKITTFYEPAKNGHIVAPFVDNSCKFGGGAVVAAPKDVAKIFSNFYSGAFSSTSTLNRFVPAISRPCEAVSMGGEGIGGRAAFVAYPSDNLVVVLLANARGGDLKPYAQQIADLVANVELQHTAACHRS